MDHVLSGMFHCPVVSGVYFTKEGNRAQEDPNVPLTKKPHLLASHFVDVRVCAHRHAGRHVHVLCVCMCASMNTALHTLRAHAHTRTHIYAHTHLCNECLMCTRLCMCMHIYISICIHMQSMCV